MNVKSESSWMGLKWMQVGDVIQIKMQQCLIIYDLNRELELNVLNRYIGVNDVEANFVPTPFAIPVKDGAKPTNNYYELNNEQTVVRCYKQRLTGRLFNLHDELDLHGLVSI